VLAFADQFKAKHGSLTCRTLLNCDISTPDGRQAAQDQNLFRTKCDDFVRDAATIVESLLPPA
jgi:hypothetical protein